MANAINLRRKLKDIEKTFKTFATTDDSEKKIAGTQKSAYKYTPGWSIVESIRAEMDKQDIMLEMQVIEERHEMVSYPVYKLIEKAIHTFEKKEMYVTLTCEFTWIDVQTGERIGPIRLVSAGANGIDKSISSAISLAERYFFLKYFHISTREQADEPDAHDSEWIPGIPAECQPVTLANNDGRQPAMQQPASQPQYQNPCTYMPQPAMPNQTTPQVNPEIAYETAVRTLMNFEKGTPSHIDTLNRVLVSLNLSGFNTSEPTFATRLVETAQSRRLAGA